MFACISTLQTSQALEFSQSNFVDLGGEVLFPGIKFDDSNAIQNLIHELKNEKSTRKSDIGLEILGYDMNVFSLCIILYIEIFIPQGTHHAKNVWMYHGRDIYDS